MMYLIFWIFMAYGMTSILVWGSIFESTREFIKRNSVFFGDLISCTLCTSTWVGFFFGIAYYSPSTSLIGTPNWIGWFFDGLIASGFVWAINSIVEWFEENRPNNNVL